MSKKILLLISILIIISLFISACGNKTASPSDSPSSETGSEDVSPDVSASASDSAAVSDSETSESPSADSSASPSPDASASPSASSSSSASASADSNLQKFDGYLVDVKCGERGKDEKGNDLTKNPMKHTLSCLKDHAKSGYGIFRGQGDGTFKFFPFDSDGNKQVKRYIIDKTTKKDDIRIAVRGTLDEDGKTIHVKIVMAYGLE